MEKTKKKYYYYKKKRGRHKKPGPKKRKKIRGRRWQEKWNVKIVLSNFKKQDTYIGKYHNISEALIAKEELLKQNETIIFPVKFINNGHKSNKLLDVNLEYLILKRSDDGNTNNQLRNEYGKFIDISTNSNTWMIYDRFPCLKEETFWVYGFNPRTDRKTFTWIKNNLINEYEEIVQIYLYNNKVIFRYEEENFNFVICKNVSDAIRMYNMLEKNYIKNKDVIFTGYLKQNGYRQKETIKMIKNKTGWSLNKIYQKTTRN